MYAQLAGTPGSLQRPRRLPEGTEEDDEGSDSEGGVMGDRPPPRLIERVSPVEFRGETDDQDEEQDKEGEEAIVGQRRQKTKPGA